MTIFIQFFANRKNQRRRLIFRNDGQDISIDKGDEVSYNSLQSVNDYFQYGREINQIRKITLSDSASTLDKSGYEHSRNNTDSSVSLYSDDSTDSFENETDEELCEVDEQFHDALLMKFELQKKHMIQEQSSHL